MSDTPTIDGISNARVVRKYSDILGVDYRELHFDVHLSGLDDARYDLTCTMGPDSVQRAEREGLAVDDGSATQHVMATYHIAPPSGLFFAWAPGEPIELTLYVVEDNYRDVVDSRDVTDAVADALADADEPTEQEQIDALRERVDRLEQLHDNRTR